MRYLSKCCNSKVIYKEDDKSWFCLKCLKKVDEVKLNHELKHNKKLK